MKNKILILAALALSLSFSPTPAKAASSTAATVRVLFSASTLSTSAYTQLFASTAQAVKNVAFFNTSPNPIDLAIGGSGSEVVHYTIPQGTLPGPTGSYPGAPEGSHVARPFVLPLSIAKGRRVAIRAKNSAVTLGELQFNLLY